MRTHSQLRFRPWAIAALAALLMAAQMIGQAHRVAHAGHSAESAEELWLAVANGGEVSEAAWRAHASAADHATHVDPWHNHDNESDCAQFDALCLGDLSVTTVPVYTAVHAPPATFTRRYAAHIAASVTHTHARAPPIA